MDRSGEAGTRLGRRQFLQGVAAAGALAGVGGLAAGCGGSSTPAAGSSPPASASKRRGGNLKVGLTGGSGSDTLDPHNGLTYLDTARAQSLYQPLLQLNTAARQGARVSSANCPARNAAPSNKVLKPWT